MVYVSELIVALEYEGDPGRVTCDRCGSGLTRWGLPRDDAAVADVAATVEVSPILAADLATDVVEFDELASVAPLEILLEATSRQVNDSYDGQSIL
jgi:hypothetical protein